jgi:hypothetical protein
MLDPFSLTGGIIGLLSSLTSLSIIVNEIIKDFVEAKTEINVLFRELTDLTNVLTQLQTTKGYLRLPNNLAEDLTGILRSCSDTAEEVGFLLRRSAVKRRPVRGAYWACIGKKECLQLCRGLEAHKATVNIILSLCSV